MEEIVLIIILAMAGGYTVRNFYFKYRGGKSQGGGCGCSAGDCASDCTQTKNEPRFPGETEP